MLNNSRAKLFKTWHDIIERILYKRTIATFNKPSTIYKKNFML